MVDLDVHDASAMRLRRVIVACLDVRMIDQALFNVTGSVAAMINQAPERVADTDGYADVARVSCTAVNCLWVQGYSDRETSVFCVSIVYRPLDVGGAILLGRRASRSTYNLCALSASWHHEAATSARSALKNNLAGRP